MASNRPSLAKRVGAVALVAVAVVFAVQGGEFGTLDLVHQRQEKQRVGRTVDSLRHMVDSLKRYANAVEHDPATQERIAREMFGMVRGDKEVLYRFTTRTDSARTVSR
jgi:cell division protein FtsB